jgi:hypothetical protein
MKDKLNITIEHGVPLPPIDYRHRNEKYERYRLPVVADLPGLPAESENQLEMAVPNMVEAAKRLYASGPPLTSVPIDQRG